MDELDVLPKMNIRTATAILALFASQLYGEESASDVARRAIKDKSPAIETQAQLHLLHGIGLEERIESVPVFLTPEEEQRSKLRQELSVSKQNSNNLIEEYMIGDAVPEKILIAFALNLLSSKIDIIDSEFIRLRKAYGMNHARGMDLQKYDKYSRDAAILAARLKEIEEAEQGGTGQPATRSESKPEGSNKPQPESEGRSR